jgi:pimeloyl-ACP methyl ester carboxylesterase
MKLFYLILFFIFQFAYSSKIIVEITPYKYTDKDRDKGYPVYQIPQSSRFLAKRSKNSAPDIVYYLSKPQSDIFPIAILCGGSSLENDIGSIIHFHRYFLKEFLELGSAVLTVEQQGIDGNNINAREFMENYTRSNRLQDHCDVIEALKKNPPQGWNGKLIFLGVSEGGPLVTILTMYYQNCTIATINWSGAGDFSWREELWDFIQTMAFQVPWHIKLRAKLPSWMPFSLDLYFPASKEEHNKSMNATLKNPTSDLKLAGMTYKYHADVLESYPKYEYDQIKTPFLVVAGDKDPIINSADAFVKKAEEAGATIMYMRISSMDHYIRKKEDVIINSFDWLKKYL